MKKYFLALVALLCLLAVDGDARHGKAGPPTTCPFATTTQLGCVKVDGTTTTMTNGVISAPLVSGSGNVTGPTGAVANDLASYNATTGLLIKDSGILSTNVQTITGLASPAAIGNTTPAAGAFTTLSATSTVSGAGITSLFASPPAIGGTAAAGGAFTTLSASSTVSGTGFSTYLASPPAIGGTVAAAGAFTNLSSSGAVSGTGFSTYLASPPAIGGTVSNSGAFTTLSASSTVSGTGFSNYLASPPAIGGTAPAAVVGTSFEARTGAYLYDVANAGTTGTTQFLLAKLTGAGTAVVATTSDTGGIVLGAVQSASATTGNAQIAVGGQATCTFDGATTNNDFVQVSTTAGGDCHDTGSTSFPTTGGQVLGRVLSTHAAGGNFLMVAFPPGIIPSSGGGGSLTFTEVSKTTSYTLNSTTDVGSHFDDNGASALMPFTLPTGSNGLNYCFTEVSGHSLTVTAPAGIKIAVGEQNSGAAGVLTLTAAYDSQCLKFVQTQWVAYMGQGSWTLQ